MEWIDHFNSMIDTVQLESKEYMLLDFNFDLLKPNNHWLEKIEPSNFTQLVTPPTRVINTSQTKSTSATYLTLLKYVYHLMIAVTIFLFASYATNKVKISRVTHKTITIASETSSYQIFLLICTPHLSIMFTAYQIPKKPLLTGLTNFGLFTTNLHLCTPDVLNILVSLDQELQAAINVWDFLKRNGQEVLYRKQTNFVTALKGYKMKNYLSKLVECKSNTKIIRRVINHLTNKIKILSP